MQRRLENLKYKCAVIYRQRIAFRVLHERRPCFDSPSCFLQSFTTRTSVLPVLKNKIEYGYRTLGYCPLTGYNPGSLPASLLQITSLGRHLYTSGLTTFPCVVGVKQRRKPQLTFCLSVKPWRHSDIPIRASFSGSRECQKSKSGSNLELY